MAHWPLSRVATAMALAAVLSNSACTARPEPLTEFDVLERSISELASAMAAGEVTARGLVGHYLARIESFDRKGPALRAVVTINPHAMAEAEALDAERAAGRLRGPLHGIPILVKDNFDAVGMTTSGGLLALALSEPPDDAFQVRRLREAGAIILGKTNMHELARGITTVSSIAGQTRNPYDPSRNPGGSSGGTGAAVAASFAAAGLGSDTCGSIRIPAAHHALVGLRGTRGLSSRDGMIPLSGTQDVGGPMTRSVTDLALMLDVTVGRDPADQSTRLSAGRIPETYSAFLDPRRLETARLGLVTSLLGTGAAERAVRTVIDTAVDLMRDHGAAIVEIDNPSLTERLQDASLIGLEFRSHFDEYLQGVPSAPIDSLRALIDSGLYHDVVDAGLQRSLAVETLDTAEYDDRLAARDAVRAAVEQILDERNLDALVYPTIRQTARPIGVAQPGSNCALSAVSGLPALTVPAGYADDGMPVGLELLGRAFDEPRLIGLAYAYEQATRHRRAPDFTPSLLTPPPAFLVETHQAISHGPVGIQSTLELDPSTRHLRYAVALYGVRDRDVLSIDLHGRHEMSATGPIVRVLSRRGRGRVSGRLTLEGRELQLLREGRLYLDVHSVDSLDGAARVDLRIPDDYGRDR